MLFRPIEDSCQHILLKNEFRVCWRGVAWGCLGVASNAPSKRCLTAERRKEVMVLGTGFLRSWFAELSGLESGVGRVPRVARMRYASIRQ